MPIPFDLERPDSAWRGLTHVGSFVFPGVSHVPPTSRTPALQNFCDLLTYVTYVHIFKIYFLTYTVTKYCREDFSRPRLCGRCSMSNLCDCICMLVPLDQIVDQIRVEAYMLKNVPATRGAPVSPNLGPINMRPHVMIHHILHEQTKKVTGKL